MGKRQNLLAVWQQIPIANRTVTIPAGSYSVRPSSTQLGSIVMVSLSVNTAAISSVTTTRTTLGYTGVKNYTGSAALYSAVGSLLVLTNSTTVTASRGDSTGTTTLGYSILELF